MEPQENCVLEADLEVEIANLASHQDVEPEKKARCGTGPDRAQFHHQGSAIACLG